MSILVPRAAILLASASDREIRKYVMYERSPELTIRGAGHEDRSSGNENAVVNRTV